MAIKLDEVIRKLRKELAEANTTELSNEIQKVLDTIEPAIYSGIHPRIAEAFKTPHVMAYIVKVNNQQKNS